MTNLLDYLSWRGDLTLSERPLNEIDELVLTRFAYLPFELIEWDEEETVKSLAEKLEVLPDSDLRLQNDTELLALLQTAVRFRDLPVTDFVKNMDEDVVEQFAAVTVHLNDRDMYLAFCGTDSTLLGWKEDFYMSFMEDIAAQKSALGYMRQMAEKYPSKNILLGGHSKGGNLAVYAAVNAEKALKERLTHVSNYDGPGFPDDYIASHDFASVVDRISTFIPQESVIGRIHDHAEGFSVVSSTERGLNQHNVYSWEVGPERMVRLPEPDTSSEVMYETIQNILENTDPEQRKAFVDGVYRIFTEADFSTMKDISHADAAQRNELRKVMADLPKDTRKEARDVNNAMFKSYLEAVISMLVSQIPDSGPLSLLHKMTQQEDE